MHLGQCERCYSKFQTVNRVYNADLSRVVCHHHRGSDQRLHDMITYFLAVPSFFQQISTPANITYQGSRWLRMRNTCPNNFRRRRFTNSSTNFLNLFTLWKTWTLLTWSSNEMLAILWWLWSKRWSLHISQTFKYRSSQP